MDDPVWVDRARSLLEFLQEPRDWAELEAWAHSRQLTQCTLRNTIAYADKLISHHGGRWRALVEIPQPEAGR